MIGLGIMIIRMNEREKQGKKKVFDRAKKKEKWNGEMSVKLVYSPISSTDFAFGK